MTTPKDAPHLDSIATAAEVANALGVTRQTVNRLYWDDTFKTLQRIGPENARTYVISRDELAEYLSYRKEKKGA